MKNQLIFFFMILSGLWGCTAQVSSKLTDTDKLTGYKTYAFKEGVQKSENPLYNSDQIDQEITAALKQELSVRKFVQDTVQPDFFVRYQTYVEKESSMQRNYFYPGFGWGGMFGYGGFMSGPSVSTSSQGTLVIDFIDGKSGKTVWRGFVEGNVDNVEKLIPRVSKAVKGIMKKFPVKPVTRPSDKETDDLYS